MSRVWRFSSVRSVMSITGATEPASSSGAAQGGCLQSGPDGLDRAELFQRTATVDFFAGEVDSFFQIPGQAGNHESTGGVHHCHVTFGVTNFSGQNSFDRLRVLPRTSALQFGNRCSRHPKPTHIEHGGIHLSLVQIGDRSRSADRDVVHSNAAIAETMHDPRSFAPQLPKHFAKDSG